jgi:superoxide dismutase, Cu-Zn family
MQRRILAGAVALASALAIAVAAASAGDDGVTARAEANLVGPAGALLGTVRLSERDGRIDVVADASGLPAGFHGFHVHAVGSRIGPAFTSAGDHLNPAGLHHPHHPGDMRVLLVNADGTARASLRTDRFGLADLLDADGSAIIVHAKADNYANIPTNRYDPDPEEVTLATGDSGSRVACGVIEPA